MRFVRMSLSLKTYLTFILSGFHYNSFVDHSCYYYSPPLQVFNSARTLLLILTTYLLISQVLPVKYEFSITLPRDTHSCTQHHINKLLFFSYLYPIYFNFATKLSFVSLPQLYVILCWIQQGSKYRISGS